MDNQSLAHSRYNCTYHIVFIPKYRRKVMFGNLRREVGEAIGKIYDGLKGVLSIGFDGRTNGKGVNLSCNKLKVTPNGEDYLTLTN